MKKSRLVGSKNGFIINQKKETQMEIQFKVQDSVQLLHGPTPTMTIAQINEENQIALCIWYDNVKTKTIKQDWIPLTALKHTPERQPIDIEDIKKAVYRL